jgi:acyl-CoA dehydrogenase
LSEEQDELQRQAGSFVREELLPLEERAMKEEFEHPQGISPDALDRLDHSARSRGLWALKVPASFEGRELGKLSYCVVAEELGKTIIEYVPGGSPSGILYECNEEQREKFLIPVIKGEKREAFAFSDLGGASDPSSMKTSARRSSGVYSINGAKVCSGGFSAHFIKVFAKVEADGQGAEGITCFLVEKAAPGLRLGEAATSMSSRQDHTELFLEDCAVPEANVLGGVGRGMEMARKWIGDARLELSARCTGTAERLLGMSVEYAKGRVTFGKPIGERQFIQGMLAEMDVSVQASRFLTYNAAWLADRGEDNRHAVARAKLFASEMVDRAADYALQIHGRKGYMKGSPIERIYRNVRGYRIAEGTSEIQKIIIARNLLRD